MREIPSNNKNLMTPRDFIVGWLDTGGVRQPLGSWCHASRFKGYLETYHGLQRQVALFGKAARLRQFVGDFAL